MRILLVQPNSSEQMVGFTPMIRSEPLALEIIAAAVPEHEVKILDLHVDPSLAATLSSFEPDLVGVTGYTTDVPRMCQICREVKSYHPGITVLGGYHATLCPQDFDYDFIDVIVLGEGEITFKELVSALVEKRDLSEVNGIIYRQRGQQVATKPRDLIAHLDDLPLPARHLTDRYRPHYHFQFWENPYIVETARGCPYRCTFCAVWKFHRGKCRSRAPESILKELGTIPSPIICFVDDNFLQDTRRVERLYELVKNDGIQAQYWIQARSDSIVKRPDIIKKWTEIGLGSVLVGFEKLGDEELASLNKESSVKDNDKAAQILRDNDIDIWGMFIVDPQWTKPDFDALIDYVHSLKISFPTFTILTPLPGTAFFQEKLKELTTLNYEVFDLLHSVLPTKLPIEEFYVNMARLYKSTTMDLYELEQRIKSGHIPVSCLRRVRDILREVTNPQAYLRSTEAVSNNNTK